MVAIQFCLDFLEYRRSFLKLSSEEQNLSPPPFFIIEELMRNRDTRATALSMGATSGVSVAPSLFFPPIPTGRLNDSLPPTPHTQGTDLAYAKSPPPRQSVIETNRTETLQKLGHHGRSLTWKEPPIASLLSSTPARQPTVRHTNYSMFRFSTATTLPDCVNPSSQPLRQQLHRLLAKYLGADSSALQLLSLPKRCVSQAFLEARYTTSPDVLHPIFSNLLEYLSETLLPAFIRDAKSKPSQKPIPFNIAFRVVIGILATMAACALDVLLSLNPSPLSNTRIPRPFRLFVLPLLALAVGCAIPSNHWTALRSVELPRPSMFRHRRGGWGKQKEWLDLDKIGAVEQERKRERVRAWMTIALFIGSICVLQGIVVALPFVELSSA
ncbi:hypothetical protein BT69DRAFT_199775 [Atractiella rhizophila]|nr:hypothetical protein BT69DRAFT_199775 [Atractiella rhizophila]